MDWRVTRLQQFRDDLQDARFSGVRSFRDSNGEEVTYRSVKEINAAIAAIDAEIAALQGRRLTLIRFQTSKGL